MLLGIRIVHSEICSDYCCVSHFATWFSVLFASLYHLGLQTLEMLEKKEQVLLKKAAAEVEKAKEFTRAKNKRGM